MNRNNMGAWLKHYRKEAKLSVKEVVEIFARDYDIRYTDKAVYGWESGQNQPPADTFLILCKMYNITNIIESIGYVTSKKQEPLLLTDQEEQIILKYRSNKPLQSAILKLLDIEES